MMDPEYRILIQTAESRGRLYRDLVRRLRRVAPKELAAVMQELHDEAFRRIDCLKCAHCCAVVGPRLTDTDIQRLGKALSMKPSAFEDTYLIRDEDGDLVFREHPCPFLLADNRCLLYDRRPKACREYPHTDDKHARGLLKISLVNTRFCPIVALVFQGLEERYG